VPDLSDSSGPLANVSRRSVLKGSAAALALFTVPTALIAACSSSSSKSASPTTSGAATSAGGTSATSGTAKASGTLTIGSNYSDAGVKAAFASVASEYQTSSGVNVKVNTVDHDTYQNKIQTYLQGTPDDVFAWFAGYRMKFFAAQKLATPIDDVWDTIGANFPDSIKAASKGDDGHYYFVPIYNYPWVMNYRKSLFSAKGYQIPKTWDDLITLSKKMKSDGLTPISFTDKDGWPAMGTFDILNMRINGYQFHVDLMAHKQSWTDPKVKDVFNQWKELFPYYQTGANGLTWEQGAQALQNKQTGMMFQGAGQVGQQFTAANLPDLGFFPFPEINSTYGTDSGIDAPIDGFMVSKSPKNEAAAKAFLEYLGTAQAEATYLKSDPTDVGTATNYDESTYNQLQKDSAAIIAGTKNIAQFLDRDTRPDFAYPVVQNALQGFIDSKDTDTACNSLESQAKAIFAS
jgi:multiple sugar transport system substrate-binding protein